MASNANHQVDEAERHTRAALKVENLEASLQQARRPPFLGVGVQKLRRRAAEIETQLVVARAELEAAAAALRSAVRDTQG